MVRLGAFSIITAIALVYQGMSIELLANYKLWKSVSDQLVYDYSGNYRHGRNFKDYVLTDRGVTPSGSTNYIIMNLMNYGFVKLNEYTISIWMLNFGVENSDNSIWVYDGSVSFAIYYIYQTNTILRLKKNTTVLSDTNLNLRIQGWNLHTIRFYVDNLNLSRLNINIYNNFQPIFSSYIDSGLAFIEIDKIELAAWDTSSTTTGIIFNEVWVHKGFSVISDLHYLISGSSSCGCEYKCPTTPNQTCLKSFGEIYNKSGDLCDISCTNLNPGLSCYSSNNCIQRSKAECQYGLYDRESGECTFYCPYSSCICATLAGITVSNLLTCNCITGFNKILGDGVACMSVRCLAYHRVGYKYVCDTTESGYILDTLGECCVCASGFTQVWTNPMVCVNLSICMNHSISGGDYRCSTCAVGYSIDSKGKCNSCSSGYVNVLANPYTCILKILNCEQYIYSDNTWKCSTCAVGYSGDSQGKCNSCSSGYVNVLANPYTCILKILNCEQYIYSENTWKCSTCAVGYSIDSQGKCNSCSSGYVNVLANPYICILKIEKCEQYIYSNNAWKCQYCAVGYSSDSQGKCNSCSSGYVNVLANPFTCILKIENCEQYIHSNNTWKCGWDSFRCIEYIESPSVYTCSKCQEGYKADSLSRSCICDSGYKIFIDDPIKCGYDVFRCSDYIEGDTLFSCSKCMEGYSLDALGRSCVCDQSYVKVVDNPIECIPEILNCMNYVKRNEVWMCNTCSLGYRVDPYGKCLDCDSGYSVVSYNPFMCGTEIYGCSVYSFYNDSWLCEYCAVGYRLGCDSKCCECDIVGGYIQVAQNPIVCILEIHNCLEYKLYGSIWGCAVCSKGYGIDTDLKCQKCEEGYVGFSEDPLICISKIKNCDTHTLSEEGYSCLKCEEGYRLCQGKCCECSIGYYVSINNPDTCSECPSNCKKCQEFGFDLICTSCNYGYTVTNSRCECDLEDFVYKGNSCVVKPFEVSLSYDYNTITVSFSKKLASPLSDSDFIITFHEEFDTRLLIYEIIPTEDSKQYLISFRFFMNINQILSMSLTFTDKVIDRQNLALVTKTQYTSLPLQVEGITARNEYCDSSCLECEFINGSLGCSLCYDYAFILEGVCKCYAEAIESTPKTCPAKCPEGMIIDSDLRTCVICMKCDEDSNQTQVTNHENTQQVISKKSEEYSGYSSNLSAASATTAFALGSAFGADRLWSLMNTIQIYSYLPLLSVDMPVYLQEALKSQDSTSKYFDGLKDKFSSGEKPSSRFSNFKYESSSFLHNSIKPITTICAIIICNILIYIINQITRGKLKKHSGKVLSFFNLSIYLRYFIQIYMDILLPCTLQIIYVMFN